MFHRAITERVLEDLKLFPVVGFVITPEGASTPKSKGVILCGIKEFFAEHMHGSQDL